MAQNSNSTPNSADPTTISRRVAVTGMLSIAGLAASACTQYGNPSAQPANGGGGAGAASAGEGAGAALAKASDVPVGGGMVVNDQQVVITQPTAGTYKAFSAVCTHQGCLIADVANGTINCPCHGSKFNIADGSVANGPASTPLPQRSITVADDQITLT